jgi:sulfatase modifying factor 1
MKYYQLFIVVTLILFFSCKENKKAEVPAVEPANAIPVKVEKVSVNIGDTSNMIHFEGGNIMIGSNLGEANEKPSFGKQIEPFYLDKNLISVAEFRVFIQQTAHQTEADKFGDSGVFSFETGTWSLIKDVNWEYPMGGSEPKALDNHPVTHISWNDAKAYATWTGKRLPTEFEWEFAAKNGKNRPDRYSWGPELIVNSKYLANVWQGTSALEKTYLDGYLLTSPVGAFGETKSGLTDMGGNVWQWCENVYESYPGSQFKEPSDPNVRSTRGGSFMFDQALENSYTTTFRGKNSVDTSLFNTGFRCAK